MTKVDKCPYCGSEYFVTLARVEGLVRWVNRFDGNETKDLDDINSNSYDNLNHKQLKTIRCLKCKKKVNEYIKGV